MRVDFAPLSTFVITVGVDCENFHFSGTGL